MRASKSNESRITLLRRTAKEVRDYRVKRKFIAIILVALIFVTAVLYVVAVLYKKSGSFTVSVDKYDMMTYGLTLSESRELTHKTSHLYAKIEEKMTNISGKIIPDNVDMIDGEHNGRDYIAYTFYAQNAGEQKLAYDYTVMISNVTNNLDEAIRLRLYVDGEDTTYAKTKSDGTGAEPGTTEFYSDTVMAAGRIPELEAGKCNKYTLVIWIEGNDPDCIDWLIGGKMKVEMTLSVVH